MRNRLLVGLRGAACYMLDAAKRSGPPTPRFSTIPSQPANWCARLPNPETRFCSGSRRYVEGLSSFASQKQGKLIHVFLARIPTSISFFSAFFNTPRFEPPWRALPPGAALCIGPSMIAVLGRYQIGQQVRTDGPQSHLKKAGTPTMGGLLISASIVISTLLWANLTVAAVWVALAGLVGFGAIGFWDDYTKVKHKRNLGLTARQKIMLQLLAAMLIGVLLLAMNASRQYSPDQRSILKGARRSADSRPAGQCLDLSAGVQFLRLRGVVLWGVERREPDGPGWARHRTDADAAGAMTALSFLSGNADLAKYSIWRAARRL